MLGGSHRQQTIAHSLVQGEQGGGEQRQRESCRANTVPPHPHGREGEQCQVAENKVHSVSLQPHEAGHQPHEDSLPLQQAREQGSLQREGITLSQVSPQPPWIRKPLDNNRSAQFVSSQPHQGQHPGNDRSANSEQHPPKGHWWYMRCLLVIRANRFFVAIPGSYGRGHQLEEQGRRDRTVPSRTQQRIQSQREERREVPAVREHPVIIFDEEGRIYKIAHEVPQRVHDLLGELVQTFRELPHERVERVDELPPELVRRAYEIHYFQVHGRRPPPAVVQRKRGIIHELGEWLRGLDPELIRDLQNMDFATKLLLMVAMFKCAYVAFFSIWMSHRGQEATWYDMCMMAVQWLVLQFILMVYCAGLAISTRILVRAVFFVVNMLEDTKFTRFLLL